MPGEGIYCSGCGITLMPFMKVCPRCGAVREDAKPLEPLEPLDQSSSSSAQTSHGVPQSTHGVPQSTGTVWATRPQTDVVPLDAIRQQQSGEGNAGFAPTRDIVFLSPSETQRRFPLFTKAQLTLMTVGVSLLILLLVIAYLLWRRQQRDAAPTTAAAVVVTQSTPAASPGVEPSPTPTPIDDQTIVEAVKSALTAYNPLGFSRYKLEVKEGVVTIGGEADHQPEKDGAENVIKLVSGVKSVVNNLKVKPEDPFTPVKVNAAEARLLDEALKRQAQIDEQSKSEQQKQSQPDQQREAERQRREQAATKQREEDVALRKAAEDKLRRESEDYEKRQEELRRAEADRRARAEQAKIEVGILRSGTVAWSGVVDGVEEIIFSGGSASVRHISGNPPREVRASFSAPIPRSPATVNLVSTNGRGPIQIVQQPSTSNGYTTIVRINDSGKGGEKRYEFTLKWMLQ